MVVVVCKPLPFLAVHLFLEEFESQKQILSVGCLNSAVCFRLSSMTRCWLAFQQDRLQRSCRCCSMSW